MNEFSQSSIICKKAMSRPTVPDQSYFLNISILEIFHNPTIPSSKEEKKKKKSKENPNEGFGCGIGYSF